tara:strand:- start:4755 stop:5558 length:804 start_codon:yes stop_codon:yes gene_type:complete
MKLKKKLNSEKVSKEVRKNILLLTHKAKSAHIASALSIVDILSVLYCSILKIKSAKDKNRDVFVLSKGHACLALYCVLGEMNFFSKKYLSSYGKNYTKLMAHASHHVPGVEFSTGSLGHGISFAVGKALLFKNINSNRKIFVIISDGELNEGSTWESILFAAHHNLKNLTIILDYNKIQSLDRVEKTIQLEPLIKKMQSFNLNVINVNGHNHKSLRAKLKKKSKLKPKFIIANTIKGKGVSFMENTIEWHYKSPNKNQLNKALKEIN